MRIGKFRKAAADRKRYEINYEDWLNDAEIITGITMLGADLDDGFVVDGYGVEEGGKSVVFYVSGGVEDKSYIVYATIETSLDQIKEDWVTFVVT